MLCPNFCTSLKSIYLPSKSMKKHFKNNPIFFIQNKKLHAKFFQCLRPEKNRRTKLRNLDTLLPENIPPNSGGNVCWVAELNAALYFDIRAKKLQYLILWKFIYCITKKRYISKMKNKINRRVLISYKIILIFFH